MMRNQLLTLTVITSLVVGTKEGRAQQLLGSVSGPGGGAQFGQSMQPMGDLNNDGVADFVVGAPNQKVGGMVVGTLTVISGSDSSVLLTVAGSTPGEQFGFAVGGVGDLDMDGFPDVIGGAPFAQTTAGVGGRVDVISGAAGGLIHSKEGDSNGDNLGLSVARMPDSNGDGLDEFAAGAPSLSGYVRVYSGDMANPLATLTAAAFTVFGQNIASGGDANGDGTDDLLVASPLDGLAGRVRVFSGKNYSLWRTTPVTLPASAKTGFSCAFIGDINGDGRSDFASGGGPFPAVPNSWQLTLFSGNTAGVIQSIPQRASVVDDIGFAVHPAGDLNGDTIPDVLAGAPNFGSVILSRGLVRGFSGMDGSELFSIEGKFSGDQLGHSLTLLHDKTGDFIPDFAVGGPLVDTTGGINSGSVQLWSSTGAPVVPLPIQLGDEIVGTTTNLSPLHQIDFDALVATQVTFKVSASVFGFAPVLVIKKTDGQILNQWSFPAFAIGEKRTLFVPATGSYSATMEGFAGSTGSYKLKTSRKLPILAKSRTVKLKKSLSYDVDFDALKGAFAVLTVKPKKQEFPFLVTVTDPLDQEVDLAGHVLLLAKGKVQIALPLSGMGRYTLHLDGIVESKHQFKVSLDLKQPKGKATITHP